MCSGFVSDEYTKITTPRQDVLFKKGYLGRKRAAANPSPCDTQEVHSNGECSSIILVQLLHVQHISFGKPIFHKSETFRK